MTPNDKRLIEVAFPLKQVSLDSVHEKNSCDYTCNSSGGTPFAAFYMLGCSHQTALCATLEARYRLAYGSAASRIPSPTTLKAKTAMTTKSPGSNSHGAMATA